MKTILGTSRQQMQFSSLDDFITAENPVRILDAFVCNWQRNQKMAIAKSQVPATSAAMQRHCIAINHL